MTSNDKECLHFDQAVSNLTSFNIKFGFVFRFGYMRNMRTKFLRKFRRGKTKSVSERNKVLASQTFVSVTLYLD